MRFTDHCFESHKAKYGQKPAWLEKDYAILAKAFKAMLKDEPRARAAWDAYLEDPDPFYQGHSPGMFLAQLPRFDAKGHKRRVAHQKQVAAPEMSENYKRMAEIRRQVVEEMPFADETARNAEMMRRYRK